MKFFLFILVALLVSCNDEEHESFEVEGTIKNINPATVYLEENPANGQPMIIDSSVVEQGKFNLSATVKEEGLFTLRAKDQAYPFALVINDSRKVIVDADPSNLQAPYTVKGSEASQALVQFDRSVNEKLSTHLTLVREVDSLSKMSVTDPSQKKYNDSLTNLRFAQYEANVEALKQYARNFIDESKSPILVLYALGSFQTKASQYGLRGFTKPETTEIITRASEKFPQHSVIADQKSKMKPSLAPAFTLPDTLGNPVSLAAFRGKYVLVDFWASWCAPCRKENPNIVATFNRFKDKNFTILGVSLDKDKNEWMQAIKDDGLNWNHVSDLKFWNSEAAALYGVRSIPYNVLVDPAGNIVAENLHGNELGTTLEKFLK
ncbi:MAG: redoxin domain-containing protein [Flavisolibacter sp.]